MLTIFKRVTETWEINCKVATSSSEWKLLQEGNGQFPIRQRIAK